MPGGTTPTVVQVPPGGQPEANVVYLTEDRSIEPGPPGGAIPPNHHAFDYEGQTAPTREDQPASAGPTMPPPTQLHPRGVDVPPAPVQDDAAELLRQAAELQAALPAFGSHGPLPQQHELVPPPRVDDNPFGDFFGDGPSAWLEDADDESHVPIDRPRIVGTLLAGGAVAMLVIAWAVWGLAMYRGSGGAEAGGFILLAMLLWVWYLSLPRTKQHAFMLRRHAAMQGLVDRRVTPLRERTEGQLTMRRERDRYRAMRDERSRRIASLGEGAYRSFRHGTLPAELQAAAQRVLAIERQMLVQDSRIHQLADERGASGQPGGHSGADEAPAPPDSGHPPA
ncbi:MAG: hypothetical protein JWM86_1367 [Thermoleophilia bacterium]|nr:hypothetical protein [Thermoleophilia bacterium]